MVETRDRLDPREFSSLDSWLDEEGIREEVTAVAIKRVIAHTLREAMKEQGLTKAAMASRMQTSRTQLDRVLDPNEHNVTLDTLARAANSIGRKLVVELV
ncbi:helix-turn-helix domain-containing protein [Sphingobium scionense]|uniref:DNA-binding phage protein n=1 Tax=Sphingobium scionense TaxID=1404341 RepID=A0A7W6PVT4_9SPHN|nr:helix-turn-helix transcriptional regulator [Sphingobium scionense]MBB4149113.1 DNA-binding phage protein [Sphingobium scionense]